MPDPLGGRRGTTALALILVILAAYTLVVVLVPAVVPAGINVRLALVIDAIATLVATGVAGLAWVRYREVRRDADLFRASAFLVLAALNAVFVAVTVVGAEDAVGLSLEEPGQLPLWAVLGAKAVAVILLVLAGRSALASADAGDVRPAPGLPGALVLVLPAALVVGSLAAGVANARAIPALVDTAALRAILASPTDLLDPARAPILFAAQLAIGAGFLAAGWLAYRRFQRLDDGTDGLLAAAMLIAAFSQVHFAMHPGTYVSVVATGDGLRVAFYAVMFATLARERRDEVRELGRANRELRRLHEAELAQATVEERARLAREIHDGMSQQLWFAKLKQARLIDEAHLDGEPERLAGEVARAIDAALAEARQAILALRPSDGATFDAALERYVADFADRFGIVAATQVEDPVEDLTPRAQAELLRIVQEALANVARHADATHVIVSVAARDDGIRLVVRDNGRGFDVRETGDGYGLRSMQERAALIGASLQVLSQPGDGTRVILDVRRGETRT